MTHRLVPQALVLALLLPAGAASAQSAPPDTSALQFLGFRTGARLDELAAAVRRSPDARLRCDRARRDRRVSECRATVRDTAAGPVRLWASAMDSVAGIITLSAAADSSTLRRWRGDLERRYGRVAPRVQGSQSMMQWVRRGRMIRLTWRTERGELTASVSLVDGRVLDAWGAGRAAESP
jgi:hypothetical protein